jgi:hypothetical protein
MNCRASTAEHCKAFGLCGYGGGAGAPSQLAVCGGRGSLRLAVYSPSGRC